MSVIRIIIDPAKKMNIDTDSFAVEALPQFSTETERLKEALQTMSDRELQTLWKCNDAIAKLNVERLRNMELRRNLTPAILAYEGIQYQYMAPGVMETGPLEYLREHLRILSGFYGLLRPFDGVTPYRLEMQARLSIDGAKNLYAFWGGRLTEQLVAETDCVLNQITRYHILRFARGAETAHAYLEWNLDVDELCLILVRENMEEKNYASAERLCRERVDKKQTERWQRPSQWQYLLYMRSIEAEDSLNSKSIRPVNLPCWGTGTFIRLRRDC